MWVSSCGPGLKSNEILVGYSHKFCATIALTYLHAGLIVCQKDCYRIAIHIFHLVACGTLM